MPRPESIIYLDTMIYLRFRRFDEIDWCTLLGSTQIVIRVPLITLSELDKHKDQHARKKVRERARGTIRKFRELRKASIPHQVRPNVTIQFDAQRPQVDFVVEQLDPQQNDDILIAAVLSWKRENPSRNTVLVTTDMGIELRAEPFELDTLAMPDKYRLEDELDPAEQEVTELRQKISEFENRFPDPKLLFADAQTRAVLSVKPSIRLDDEDAKERMNEMYGRFPMLGRSRNSHGTSKDALTQAISRIVKQTATVGLSENKVIEYNQELETYFDGFRRYLVDPDNAENRARRTIILDLMVRNCGTCPATDIDLELKFPDGLSIHGEDNLPQSTPEPAPPTKPLPFDFRSPFAFEREPICSGLSAIPELDFVNSIHRNVEGPSFDASNPRCAHYHVKSAKHNMDMPLDRLFVIFDSYDTACPFHLCYRLTAGNVPKAAKGQLHILVDRE